MVLETEKDIKGLISQYIACNNIDTNRKQPDGNKTPAIGWQLLAFTQNPIAYLGTLNMSVLLSVALIACYIVVTCIIIASYSISEELLIVLVIVMTILCGYSLAQINWRSNYYSNKALFIQKHRSLAIWLVIVWAISTIFGLLTEI